MGSNRDYGPALVHPDPTNGNCTEAIDELGPVLIASMTALANDALLEEGA